MDRILSYIVTYMLGVPEILMEVNVDIDSELLCEFDQAAQARGVTRNDAAREAIAAWLAQARRDAALSALFDTESSSAEDATQRGP